MGVGASEFQYPSVWTNKLADENGFKMLHNGGWHYLGSDSIPDRHAHLLSATGTLTGNKVGHILSLFLLKCSSEAGLHSDDRFKRNF